MDKVLLSVKEIRNIQLNLLKEIHNICLKENLSYFMAYGSLLGAVRHRGFIPWDDDIDICMLRKDYEHLKILIKKGECRWMSIVDEDTPGYYLQFMKVVDNRTIADQEDTTLKHGVWVDIFPLDNIPQSRILQKVYLYIALLLRDITLAAVTDFKSNFSKNDKKRGIKKFLNYISRVIGIKRFYNLYKRFCLKYMYVDTGIVSCLCTQYVRTDILTIAEAKKTIEMEFEGEKFWGLSSFNNYLRNIYGNYMQLPPENKRRTHHIVAWWK